MSDDPSRAHADINPAIDAMLKSAHDMLTHEHSLFRSLRLKPVLIGRGKATFALDAPAEFANAAGAVHGGLMTIAMDSIFGLAVFTALDEIKQIATINLRTDYLGEIEAGARMVCACECVDIRDEVAFVAGRITREDNGDLLATGAGAFIVGMRGQLKGARL